MSKEQQQLVVNAERNAEPIQKIWSVNEWGKLREVIVGDARGAYLPSMRDVSQRSFDRVDENELHPPAPGPMPDFVIEETMEDIDGLSSAMEEFGVLVHRADFMESQRPVESPLWTADQETSINIRDLTFIHGNLVIDATSPTRGRYFESFVVRDLLDAFLMDCECGWYISPPKPRLPEETYDLNRTVGINEREPIFDAANCVRFGNDIIIDINNTANLLAAKWLQRALDAYYPTNKIRIHTVSLSPDHIDVVIIPLREGQAIYNPKYVRRDQLPSFLSNWDLIESPQMVPQPYFSGTPKASNWIGLNLLVLDGEQRTVIVEERQAPLIRTLEQHGYTPVPVRWRHGRTWGGAFHCVTLDVHREGTLS